MVDIEVNRDVHGYPGPSIDLAAIERELANLWKAPSVPGVREAQIVPTRTSVLNFVVYAATPGLAERTTTLMEHLSAHHPSRAIVFAVCDDPDAFRGDIDAHVEAHCHATATDRYAACFEQITIMTPQDGLEYLPSIIAPLSLPDLPTFLYWPGQPPFGDPRFLRIVRVADRLIYDSLDFSQVPPNLIRAADLARRVADSCVVTDLNWERLTPWREMVARFFDMPDCRWALPAVVQLTFTYGRADGAPDNPAQALLCVGWAANRLGWHVGSVERPGRDGWEFRARRPDGADLTIALRSAPAPSALQGYLMHAELVADDGRRTGRFIIERVGDDLATGRMSLQVGPQTRVCHAQPVPPPKLGDLLVRELQVLTRDELFEDALGEARRFAALMRGRGKGR